MALPAFRNPIRPLRGTKAALEAELANLPEGELVYATDESQPYLVEVDGLGTRSLAKASGSLTAVNISSPLTGGTTDSVVNIGLPVATGGNDGAMSAADKTKLDGVAESANAYVLPAGTLSTLGGVKADGASITIDPDGTIHAAGTNGAGSVTTVSGSAPIEVVNGTTAPVISVLAATTSAAGVVQLADNAAIQAGTAGRVVDAAGLAAVGAVPPARQVIAGTGLSGGGALSGDVTLEAVLASNAEALAGISNAALMTPLRTAEVVAGRVPSARQVATGTGLTGGGSLGGDLTLSAVFASQAEAEAGVLDAVVMSPVRVKNAIDFRIVDNLASLDGSLLLSAAQGRVLDQNKVPNTRSVIAGSGLGGGGNLSGDVTLNVAFASQVEAEAAVATDKVMSPLRVSQALGSRVPTGRNLVAGTGLIGGGTLDQDRSFALTGQALALHNLATTGLVTRTGSDTLVTRTLTVGDGLSIVNAGGVAGNPQISGAFASQAQAEAGSVSNLLMSPLRVSQAITALATDFTLERETFTASGTFTKAANDVAYLVELWGGGGSGARTATAEIGGGGGGGGYGWRLFSAAEINATVSVVVGAGGAAVSAVGGASGNAGGTTSFGGYLGAYGGLGGNITGFGGQGGGLLDPAVIAPVAQDRGGFLGAASGWASVYGGGGGNSGVSVFGGGGGGSSIGLGGVSDLAGNGGAGATNVSASDGAIPAGGGGGVQTGSVSGAGARGEVRVYRFKR